MPDTDVTVTNNEAASNMLSALTSDSAPAGHSNVDTSTALEKEARDAIEGRVPLDKPAAQPGKQPTDKAKPDGQPAGLRNLLTGQPKNGEAPVADEGKSPRVFTGLDEVETKRFKNMSREAYDDLYPKYLEYKQLSPHKDKLTKLPELEKELNELRSNRWYDHPESYRLTEEYSKAQSTLNSLTGLYNHFATQLDALEAGAKEVEMLQFDDTARKLVSVKVPVDASTRRLVQEELSSARMEQGRVQQAIENLRTQHTTRYTNHRSDIEKFRASAIGQYKDLLGEPSKKKLANFPGYYQNDPSAPIVADLLALVDMIAEKLDAQEAKAPAAAANARAAKLASPARDGLQPNPPSTAGTYTKTEYDQWREQGLV